MKSYFNFGNKIWSLLQILILQLSFQVFLYFLCLIVANSSRNMLWYV